ncbi:MAG: hypothetical protein LBT36_01990, partial [Oscillospiraceae bacterium]|nr:hypothetical protein [Oscillospiraceae bacterium]
MTRQVTRAQDLALEVYFALQRADAVVITGSLDNAGTGFWQLIDTAGEVYRRLTGRTLRPEDAIQLSGGDTLFALRVDAYKKPIYFVPDHAELAVAAYAMILQNLLPPSAELPPPNAETSIMEQYHSHPPSLETRSPAPAYAEPSAMAADAPGGEPAPAYLSDAMRPWESDEFAQMWGHPVQGGGGDAPFEPPMPQEYHELRRARMTPWERSAPATPQPEPAPRYVEAPQYFDAPQYAATTEYAAP